MWKKANIGSDNAEKLERDIKQRGKNAAGLFATVVPIHGLPKGNIFNSVRLKRAHTKYHYTVVLGLNVN